MTLAWNIYNSRGILWDAQHGWWFAGHVQDVFEVSPGVVLAAAETGGVWLLLTGAGLPLSMDWDSPDMNVLARGPRGESHYLAGGATPDGLHGALYETDTSSTAPLFVPWQVVALPAEVGAISRMVVAQGNRLVLATSTGLWFGTIPASPGGSYGFQQPYGMVANPAFRDVVLTTPTYDTILAATEYGNANPGYLGLYIGGWNASGRFVMNHLDFPFPLATFNFPALAVSSSHPSTAYIACCDAGGLFNGVMRTTDGGYHWELPSAGNAVINENSQMGWSGALAVSPFNPDLLVLGYTSAYLSRDGGATFTGINGPTHADKHSYRFTPAGRLYEGSDGGVTYTDDLGATWRSGLCEHLADLQFLGPTAREFWGRSSASAPVKGLVGGGLQDNGDVYSLRAANGSVTPWQPVGGGGDGQAVFFPGTAGAIVTNTTGDLNAMTANWQAPDLVQATDIPVRIAKPGRDPSAGTGTGVSALVAEPNWRNAAGKLLIGMMGAGTDVYGLFANDDDTDEHWDYLGTLPLASGQIISAIASFNGAPILAGVRGMGQVWRIYPGNFDGATPSTGFPPAVGWDVVIVDIVATVQGSVYAIFADTGGRISQIYWSYWLESYGDFQWAPIWWLPGPPINCLAHDRYQDTLYAATDDQVYASTDGGQTWTSQSAGLPRWPHCMNLAVVYHPGGTGYLYLSTFGWSTWVAALPSLQPPQAREVNPVLVPASSDAGRVLVPIHSPEPGPELGLAIYRLSGFLKPSASRTIIQREAIKSAQSALAQLDTKG
jgi:hypothetical protein